MEIYKFVNSADKLNKVGLGEDIFIDVLYTVMLITCQNLLSGFIFGIGLSSLFQMLIQDGENIGR